MRARSLPGQSALRGPFLAASLTLLVLAAGCRDEPRSPTVNKQVSVTVLDGRSTEAGGFTIADLPAFSPPYPGAEVKALIGRPGEGVKAGLLVQVTQDPVAKVAAFYDARAKASGVTPSLVVTEADGAVRMFAGKGNDGRAGGAMVAIGQSDEGPGTEIVITTGVAEAEMAGVEREPDAWREKMRPPVRLQ